MLVCKAACGEISAKEYYTELMQMARNHKLSKNLEKNHEIICQIAEVMIKHYDFYIENIWDREQKKILEYIPKVLHLFEENHFTEKAEKVVGSSLPSKFFIATLVTSVENGAEAIDITREQDVFGIERTPVDAFYFIGHEFIIYLLFEALKEENAFKEFGTWNVTEGLAEFYLKQVIGDTRFFTAQQKYVDYFEKCCSLKILTAVELYKRGLEIPYPLVEE